MEVDAHIVMKNRNVANFIIRFILISNLVVTLPVIGIAQPVWPANSPKDTLKEFSISYHIEVNGHKGDHIAETYNGGVKTVFVQNQKVHVRQVSLMRIQSIFFSTKPGRKGEIAAVVKESGTNRYKFYLNQKDWKHYNSNTDSITCKINENDSLIILGKVCRKALVSTGDKSKLTVWYYPGMHNNMPANAEPVFKCIPGIVLKYMYKTGKKSLTYTAERFETKPIALNVFVVPAKGYKLIQYQQGRQPSEIPEIDNETEEAE